MIGEHAFLVVGVAPAFVGPYQCGLEAAAVVTHIVHHPWVRVQPGYLCAAFDGQHLRRVGISCVRIASTGQNSNCRWKMQWLKP